VSAVLPLDIFWSKLVFVSLTKIFQDPQNLVNIIQQCWGRLHENLSTFILLTAVQIIVYLNISAMRDRSYVSIGIMDTFTLLIDSCKSATIQVKSTVAFSRQNDAANALHFVL
jgi:hypothetical protein